MMVNFMRKTGWASVPRYLVKPYFEYFCEGVFLDEIDIISMDFALGSLSFKVCTIDPWTHGGEGLWPSTKSKHIYNV